VPDISAGEHPGLNTVTHMRDAVFFEGPTAGRKLNRFWILLGLAAVIATTGVVGDSTATVIGAMIVAPLMLPIQGTMLAVVLGDRRQVARSVGLVAAGATAAAGIGYLVGLLVVNPVIAETNSQVAARVHPRLIDLLAALATGVVGSVALVRKDISDTLPGVAIAISLVPPLTVVGLTLESGEPAQAAGALLLFLTNVAAILVTGTGIMAYYRVHHFTPQLGTESERRLNRRRALVMVAALMALILVPLTISTVKIARETGLEQDVGAAARDWANTVGWNFGSVTNDRGGLVVRLTGPLPLPDPAGFKALLVSRGVDVDDIRLDLIPTQSTDLGTLTP
jgi:uncharacterized hydrophobic protein (TIGR00271 family)